MRKIIFTFFILSLFTSICLADNDRITTEIKELPVKSREFIEKYFPNIGISHIKIEYSMFRKTGYDVILTNGVDIEFNKTGEWTEVDANHNIIPGEIIPEQIADYIRTHFNNRNIISIEREKHETSVKLDNETELTFNHKGKLIDIDH